MGKKDSRVVKPFWKPDGTIVFADVSIADDTVSSIQARTLEWHPEYESIEELEDLLDDAWNQAVNTYNLQVISTNTYLDESIILPELDTEKRWKTEQTVKDFITVALQLEPTDPEVQSRLADLQLEAAKRLADCDLSKHEKARLWNELQSSLKGCTCGRKGGDHSHETCLACQFKTWVSVLTEEDREGWRSDEQALFNRHALPNSILLATKNDDPNQIRVAQRWIGQEGWPLHEKDEIRPRDLKLIYYFPWLSLTAIDYCRAWLEETLKWAPKYKERKETRPSECPFCIVLSKQTSNTTGRDCGDDSATPTSRMPEPSFEKWEEWLKRVVKKREKNRDSRVKGDRRYRRGEELCRKHTGTRHWECPNCLSTQTAYEYIPRKCEFGPFPCDLFPRYKGTVKRMDEKIPHEEIGSHSCKFENKKDDLGCLKVIRGDPPERVYCGPCRERMALQPQRGFDSKEPLPLLIPKEIAYPSTLPKDHHSFSILRAAVHYRQKGRYKGSKREYDYWIPDTISFSGSNEPLDHALPFEDSFKDELDDEREVDRVYTGGPEEAREAMSGPSHGLAGTLSATSVEQSLSQDPDVEQEFTGFVDPYQVEEEDVPIEEDEPLSEVHPLDIGEDEDEERKEPRRLVTNSNWEEVVPKKDCQCKKCDKRRQHKAPKEDCQCEKCQWRQSKSPPDHYRTWGRKRLRRQEYTRFRDSLKPVLEIRERNLDRVISTAQTLDRGPFSEFLKCYKAKEPLKREEYPELGPQNKKFEPAFDRSVYGRCPRCYLLVSVSLWDEHLEDHVEGVRVISPLDSKPKETKDKKPQRKYGGGEVVSRFSYRRWEWGQGGWKIRCDELGKGKPGSAKTRNWQMVLDNWTPLTNWSPDLAEFLDSEGVESVSVTSKFLVGSSADPKFKIVCQDHKIKKKNLEDTCPNTSLDFVLGVDDRKPLAVQVPTLPEGRPSYMPWFDPWSGQVDRRHKTLSPERREKLEGKLRQEKQARAAKIKPLLRTKLKLSSCFWQSGSAQYRAGIGYAFNPEDAYFLSKLPLPTEAVLLGNDPLWSLALYGLCDSLESYISKIPQGRRRSKVRELAALVLEGSADSVSELSAKLQTSERWTQTELVKIKELIISEKSKIDLRK